MFCKIEYNEKKLDASKVSTCQQAQILRYASDNRKFEISSFWQRSVFFWGFVAAAFIAYAALYQKNKELAYAIACFGVVCSFAWTLLNRGSKYWQEAWEQKVESVENAVLGVPLFSNREPLQEKKVWGARRYSVSKLTIMLSDFSILVWIALAVIAARNFDDFWSWDWPLIAAIATLAYVVLILKYGRTSPPKGS